MPLKSQPVAFLPDTAVPGELPELDPELREELFKRTEGTPPPN